MAFECGQGRNEDVVQRVSGRLAPHVMTVAGGAGVDVALSVSPLDAMAVVDIAYTQDVLIEDVVLDSRYLVHFTDEPGNWARVNGREVALGPDRFLISTPGDDLAFFLPGGSAHLTLGIEEFAWQRLTGLSRQDTRCFRDSLLAGGHAPLAQSDWQSALRHAVKISKQHQRAPVGTRQIVQRMSGALVGLLAGTKAARTVGPVATGGRVGPASYVFAAMRWIEAMLDQDIRIGDVAQRVGVSERSLRKAFLRFLGQSPSDYIRDQRLHRLHGFLQDRGREDTMSSLMLECGITSWGRYAGHYRDLFGHLPSDVRSGKADPGRVGSASA